VLNDKFPSPALKGLRRFELRGRLSPRDSFIFRFKTFSNFESALEEIFSPSAASVILYMAARKCGALECKELLREVGAREEAMKALSRRKREENWGEISFQDVNFSDGEGRVVVLNSFEAVARRSDEACCHFLRGFLAGFLSELLSKNVVVVERKCAAKGDEYCEFVFK